ncbi:MAG: cell division ATP-binding protein FtsE [Clostridia bacterium]|nr:cell division ATP-binding protein FtsE [Clostridia bacterium]
MIELYNVSKVYPNNTEALSNINIRIDNGEFVFIVGASGAGKSTFLKLLLREITPTSGEIIINDFVLSQLKRREIPYFRRNLGVVFQDFRLISNKTVYENVAFAMEIVEASSKDIKRRVPMVLNMVRLGQKANNYPSELSGGEQQRVSLARAIVNNPSILIADEPTGNLDPDTSWGIMKLLIDINRRGTTVIIATHDRDIVNLMRKRVITLRKGFIVRDMEKGVYDSEVEDY